MSRRARHSSYTGGDRQITPAHTTETRHRSRRLRGAIALVAAAVASLAVALCAPAALGFEGQLDPAFCNNGLELRSTGISSGAPRCTRQRSATHPRPPRSTAASFPSSVTIFAADGRTVVADNLGASSATVQNVTPVALVPMPDGQYMAVGHQHLSADSNQIVLARFNANGTPDLGFGLRVVPERFVGPSGTATPRPRLCLTSTRWWWSASAAPERARMGSRACGSSTSRVSCCRRTICGRQPSTGLRPGSVAGASSRRPPSPERARSSTLPAASRNQHGER